jgi:uncharacterized repeat protein (TIGR01451 family)
LSNRRCREKRRHTMKNTALSAVLVLIALLGATSSASAQCDAILSDGLGPNGGTYQIGGNINYYVTLSCPDISCPLTVDRIEFYPPPGSDDACDDTPLFFIEPGVVLTPGAAPVVWTVAEWPDLAYTIQPGDAGTFMEANICTKFSWTSAGVPLDDEDTASSINFVECPEPCIEVTKTVDCDISKVGDTVTYEICIENCGTYFDLTSVEVYDEQLASVYGSPLSGFPSSLAPGEQFCMQFDYEIQPGDDTGADYPGAVVTNTAHVTSIDSCDGVSVVEDFSDEVTVYLVHPGIDVEKVCLTPYVMPGEDPEFGITIHNTGDIPLYVTTDEPGVGPLTLDAYSSTDQFVVTGTCGDPAIFSKSNVGRGLSRDPVTNEINVTATIPSEYCDLPNEYYAYDSATCECIGPCVDVTKEVDCDISKVGDTVVYTICVTNCSDPAAELVNVSVIDDVLGNLSTSNPYGDPFPTTLAVGEQVCRTFTYEIQPGDDSGADYPSAIHENTVTVYAEHASGYAAEPAMATEQVMLVHPGIDVEKVCLTPYVMPGGDVQFGITIHNTGDIELDVTTDEAGIGPMTIPAYTSTDQFVVTFTCDTVYNEINVTATVPEQYCALPNEYYAFDSAECECIGPCIDVTKEVDCDVSKVGDTVVYTICVTNCSDPAAELVNVTVDDDVLGDLTVSNPYGDPFPTTLAAGEQVCRTFSYEIQPGDDDGQNYPDAIHENTVTVTGEHAAGYAAGPAMATEQVMLVHPGIDVEKVCLTPEVPTGGEAQFGVTITNTGDIPLDVTTDEAGIGPMTVPAFTSTDQFIVTATCGGDSVHNAINVTATVPEDYCALPNEYFASASATCYCVEPCIDVTKEVDCEMTKVGDMVVYEICVTNCSVPAAPLENVTVVDDVLGDLTVVNPYGDPFPTTLAADETVCRTFTYELQPDDDSGLDYPGAEHTNTVTVNGTNEAGHPAEPASDSATVLLVHPDFTVTKVCVESPVPDGQPAEFDITITNTGDIALDLTTDETEIPTITSLGPDEVYTHRVSRDCVAGEVISNTITVTATIAAAVNDCNLPNEIGPKSATGECECPGGTQGCTPGFWGHPALREPICWCDRFDPNDLVGDVFDVPAELSELASETLEEAVTTPGGGGTVAGRANQLLFHGVAAMLNGCSPDVAYPMGADAVIDFVNEALATLDAGAINDAMSELAGYNELGCSIDAHCNPIEDEEDPQKGLNQENLGGSLESEIENREMAIPRVAWSQPVPNPFNETTNIRFGIPQSGSVRVEVFDVSGKLVTSLLDTSKPAGTHEVVWNGRNAQGVPANSGVYFYRITLDDEILMRKMMLVR